MPLCGSLSEVYRTKSNHQTLSTLSLSVTTEGHLSGVDRGSEDIGYRFR